MYRVKLTRAFTFYHGGFRPVEYGPGIVENMPEDAVMSAKGIEGLVDGMQKVSSGNMAIEKENGHEPDGRTDNDERSSSRKRERR